MKDSIRHLISITLVTLSTTARAQFDYVTNADGTSVTITGYSGPPAVVVPGSINGLTVTSIGEDAFSDDVTSVTIADTVTNIGQEAFDGCSSLTNLVIPDSVIEMDYAAFAACGLSTVEIPATMNGALGEAAFANCEGLTNVTFEWGLPIIQTGMFSTCTALATVTIPSSVTNISHGAFYQCTSLTEVFFAGNAPQVDNTVFQDFYSNGIGGNVPYYIATAYYLPGTTGWAEFSSNTFIQGTNIVIPTVEWDPTIQATGTNFGVKNGQYGFDVTGATNLPIAIEACDDLSLSNWVVLQRLILTNGLYHFSEPFVSTNPARFYRMGFP